MRKYVLVILFSLVSGILLAAPTLPNVEIIATGGTIAGTAKYAVSTKYVAGSISAAKLLNSVSGLNKIANISYEQVFNKDSGDLTLDDWKLLAEKVRLAIANPKINAIVITHGTDTMEETSFFLDLVIKSSKPIVLVGAMRPASSLSADGTLNLYNAVAVAVNRESMGRGVLVVMNDHIFDGVYVSKKNTTNVNAFSGLNYGNLGTVIMGDVRYNNKSIFQIHSGMFFQNNLKHLPKVIVLYEHVGVDKGFLQNVLKTDNLRGIIIAGVGDGNIPSYEASFLLKARKKGIVIVRSSRVGSVTYNYNNLDQKFGLVDGNLLNPQKARILSLLKTDNIVEIQNIFNRYE
jgi:L-asparaginase